MVGSPDSGAPGTHEVELHKKCTIVTIFAPTRSLMLSGCADVCAAAKEGLLQAEQLMLQLQKATPQNVAECSARCGEILVAMEEHVEVFRPVDVVTVS